MHIRPLARAAAAFLLLAALGAPAQDTLVRRLETTTDESSATLRVHANHPLSFRIPALITGKFAEHLRENIYGGMSAEILRNPTFAEYPFSAGENQDGIVKFETDPQAIDRALHDTALRWGWPMSELNAMVLAHKDALAAFWTRQGLRADVTPSPDAGPNGGRAQRVEVKAAGEGIAQWTWLPLPRAHRYEYEVFARSPNAETLTISLAALGAANPDASAVISGLSAEWKKFSGVLELPPSARTNFAYKLRLTANTPGQFVVQHVFLQPADNIDGADPDIVRFLRDSHLPLLRWPGGNFVSSYHWKDGVGPVEMRPTLPNYAWGAIEPNLFGTDEFMKFCRAVGCEPMICVNAGSGSPEEAAQWIEYCNGAADTPMGRWRAANGHPEPYHVKYWEVGNELWGHWQYDWTTPEGYVDRYHQFAAAMRKADPGITLLACGAPVLSNKRWNDILIAGDAPEIHCITDHPLIGGDVERSVDPLDVYRDFMSVPEILEGKWAALRDQMASAGIREPHLAITELQLFAHLAPLRNNDKPAQMTPETFPSQPTITEAVYDILIYHAAVRLGSFVELITHSAVVNHGGGLRKQNERVYANPCYYAQKDFTAFANATPVPVEIACPELKAPCVLPELRDEKAAAKYSAVDAIAAIGADGDLLLSIVNRNTKTVHLTATLEGWSGAATANVRALSAPEPWAANTLDAPEAIVPRDSTLPVTNGQIQIDLAPYSIVQISDPAVK